ncbi:hypothetical protein ACLOJK_040913 [Asimina triloba]
MRQQLSSTFIPSSQTKTPRPLSMEEEKSFDSIILDASASSVITSSKKLSNSSTPPALPSKPSPSPTAPPSKSPNPFNGPPILLPHLPFSDPPSPLSLYRCLQPSLLSVPICIKLLLNCIDPFHLYGEPIVAACVEADTNYLDVSGEPEFMEKMEEEEKLGVACDQRRGVACDQRRERWEKKSLEA